MLLLALAGIGKAAEHHHVSPIHPEYAALPPFKRDVEAAKKLLAEAGYPTGIDLEFTISNDRPYYPILAQGIIEQWQEAGIRERSRKSRRQLTGMSGIKFPWVLHPGSTAPWASWP